MIEPATLLAPTTLVDIAAPFKAVVFDQWGVLHNGSTPYPGAAEAIEALANQGKTLAVLSNSGKRAEPNVERIALMGLPTHHFAHVMTSGEAFWQDCARGRAAPGSVFPITAKPGDFEAWRQGLAISKADSVLEANAVLLMGLPEGADGRSQMHMLELARDCDLPLYCTNPDKGSPRADGAVQLSPGALAHAFQDAGGKVIFYGKPHRPIFDVLIATLALEPGDILMVGDSLEHDIAGGASAGWKTAFVMGGLHAHAVSQSSSRADPLQITQALAWQHASPLPDFLISHLADIRV